MGELFHGYDREISILDMLNDLNSLVSYCENNHIARSDALRELGGRLIRRADELEAESIE